MRCRIVLACLLAGAWLAPGIHAQTAPIFNAPTSTGPARDALQDADTFVSFIDNALPRSQVRFYFDDFTRVRRPTRAGYLFPNLPLPETSVDYSQITTYGEVAIIPGISAFVATPVLFLDPDVNRNYWGLGDMNLGFKAAFLNTENLVTTFQLRAYVPTADERAIGTHQVSFEPALLLNFNLLDFLTLEGEGRYWVPVGGNQYNGDMLRYGLGLAYGQRDPSGIWFSPILEGVGWSILGGREMIGGPDPTVVSSRGETIFNLYGGFRLGLGNSMSIYAGYGRALTGDYWYKDVWRLEFRLFF